MGYIVKLFFGHRYTQRGKAATKQAFNPQISQISQILLKINKNNKKSIGFHDLPSKNLHVSSTDAHRFKDQ